MKTTIREVPHEPADHRQSELPLPTWLGLLKQNICPNCLRPIVQRRQIGRCMYAQCGHALYTVR